MSLLFVNGAHETFTPTQSGALATIIWQCCGAARREGEGGEPWVVSIDCEAEPYAWERTRFISYPALPGNRWLRLPYRVHRKVRGYRHLRHEEYARRVGNAIEAAGLAGLPMVLFNDPELAVWLRGRFPRAVIAHWFQNSHDCSEKFRRLFVESVNHILAVSDFTARWVSEFYRVPIERIRVVHNAVDCEQFSPGEEPVGGVPVINFVGRTHPVKGPDLLLKACVQLAATTRDFAVQILGSNYFETYVEDDYQRELRRLANQLRGLGIEVRMAGHVSRLNLPIELRRAQIHVVPARWDEPFGMTSLEGMACGLATVASATGGTPEVVGDAVLQFEREDVVGLCGQLARLVGDENLRSEYARRGRCRALEFSWVKTWRRLSEVVGVGSPALV